MIDSVPPITAPPPKNILERFPEDRAKTSVTRSKSATTTGIQLRPVESESPGPCTKPTPTAADNVVTTLTSETGTCLTLAPADLVLRRAKGVKVTVIGSTPTIEIKLDTRDAPLFDAMADRNFQQRVAIVVSGRVLMAPVLMERRFGGRLQVSGNYSMAEAKQVTQSILDALEPVAH